MKYEDYIKLGFDRVDLHDPIVISETGYGGFSLSKNVNEIISVSVYSEELDNPKMYIRKGLSDTYHIISITDGIVKSLFQQARS